MAGGTPYTPAEDELLREWYGPGTARRLAASLGRSVSSVYRRAEFLRLIARVPVTARVAELHAGGLSDREMAAAIGCDRGRVKAARQRLGLPPHRKASEARRESSRRQMKAQLAAAGVACLRRLNPTKHLARRAALARQYGLPEDLHTVQVRLLVRLASGPSTAPELARLLGRKRPELGYHAFHCAAAGGCNHLTDLRRRGLVAVLGRSRGEGGGAGRGQSVYFATALALDLMRRAKPDPCRPEAADE